MMGQMPMAQPKAATSLSDRLSVQNLGRRQSHLAHRAPSNARSNRITDASASRIGDVPCPHISIGIAKSTSEMNAEANAKRRRKSVIAGPNVRGKGRPQVGEARLWTSP
jgi:hypothetical protein